MKAPNITPGEWRMTIHTPGSFRLVKVEAGDRVIFDGFRGEEPNARHAAASPKLAIALIACYERLAQHDDQSAPECLLAIRALLDAGYAEEDS
jgi:hypothetical protein